MLIIFCIVVLSVGAAGSLAGPVMSDKKLSEMWTS